MNAGQDFFASYGDDPPTRAQIALVHTMVQRARRMLGADPARCAMFEQLAAQARDALKDLGVDPDETHLVFAVIGAASISAESMAANLKKQPEFPEALLPILDRIVDGICVSMTLAAGLRIGRLDPGTDIEAWVAEQDALAQAEQQLRETGL